MASVRLAVSIVAVVSAVVVSAAQAPDVTPALRDLSPVTDEMLRRPGSDDWLHWRRTSDAWGYSPLAQINRSNVRQLQLVWSWAADPGDTRTTPLVHDGVMFLASAGGIVRAFDATNGDLFWEYRDKTSDKPWQVRGISIFEDKIFLNTNDARLVAIDMRTGKAVWDVQVADAKKGFRFSAGSLIAGGKVISGMQTNNFLGEKNAITAHDARTGKELWRRQVIALPGEPGGDTWGDVPALFRAGGDMYTTGSYDPGLNLIYWSTSQAKPHTRSGRGTDGDALYSNTTLALHPEDGRIVWHRQWIPGEQHDLDENYEQVLVDVDGRTSLFKMGKLGVLWEADRRTGQVTHATDVGYQNIYDVNSKTGQLTFRPGFSEVPLGQSIDMCPSISGFKSTRSMAYHPATRAFYIPMQLTCAVMTFVDVKKVEGSSGSSLGHWKNYLHPQGGGNLGEFLAMDISGKVLWRHRQRAAFTSSALTTAGGLAFIGDWNRYLDAFDAKTGELLWQTRLGASVEGGIATYAVRGRQYLAVMVGTGGTSWATTVPAETTPELTRPRFGNAIVVFALPSAKTSGR